MKTFKFTGGLGRDVLFGIVFLGAQKNFGNFAVFFQGRTNQFKARKVRELKLVNCYQCSDYLEFTDP